MRQRIPQSHSKHQQQQQAGGASGSDGRGSGVHHRTHSGSRPLLLDETSNHSLSSGGGGGVGNSSLTSWEITSSADQDVTTNDSSNNHPLHYYNSSINPIPSSSKNPGVSPGSMPLLWDHHRQPPSLLSSKSPTSFSELRSSSQQLPSLAPGTFIPDSKYQQYLMGQPWNAPKTSKPVMTKLCCANFCIIFSWIAFLFLVFIGILLDVQPLYIPHVLPKHEQYSYSGGKSKSKTFYTVLLSERLEIASNAYKAALMYGLTGLISYAYTQNFWGYFNDRRRRQSMGYQDIPDNGTDVDSTIPYGLDIGHHHGRSSTLGTATSGAGLLPTHHPVMRAYQYNKGLSSRVFESVSVMTNRVGLWLAQVWPRYQDRRLARRRRYQTGAKDI